MIIKKTPAELQAIRESGRTVAQTLLLLEKKIKAGVTTEELDREAENFIRASGGRPSFKGYRSFPASICVSVNEGVVHGIPGGRRLKDGDIVSIDVGVERDGFHADAASTFGVGEISPKAMSLLAVTRAALEAGIGKAVARDRLSNISHAIQTVAEEAGYSVVREFVGHGIGRQMHEDPQVPNFGLPGRGPWLEPGMVLAIEPMVNEGGPDVEVLPDRWGVVTLDRRLSAHFEHTVAIMEEAPWILTTP